MKSSAVYLCVAAAFWLLLPGVRGQTTPTLTTLHSFTGTGTDGAVPTAALVQGSDGNFYGTTVFGGTSGSGTVFKMTPAGVLTTLYNFTGVGTDGSQPSSALIQASDGNFYGTTEDGGHDDTFSGTVFQMTPAGVVTTLYPDGELIHAGLVQGVDGNLYGTDVKGGNDYEGSVFEITPAGAYTLLHSFDFHDGIQPYGTLVQGDDGKFYGTTSYDGEESLDDESYQQGTVFSITAAGVLTTLHAFTGLTDGSGPQGALVQGSDGNFYGTTVGAGPFLGGDYGTVFKITPDGILTTLYDFGNGGTGSYPYAALVQASDGKFYGTTYQGGYGTIFSITAAGVFSSVYVFSGSSDGAYPMAGLIQGSDGDLYGVANYGGGSNKGTVFKLSGVVPPSVHFSVRVTNTLETAGSVTLTVNRTGGGSGGVTVGYSTADGTALAGTDYSTVSGILAWADGDAAAKTITVPVLDPGVQDGGTRAFFVQLADATGEVLGVPARARVNVFDPAPVVVIPTVTVTAAGDAMAVEGSGGGGERGKVLVERTGDTSQPLTVSYKVKGSAKAGVDFKPLPGTVTIPAGASKAKVKIKPLDNLVAGTRKVKLILLPASDGSYTVGDPASAKIKVIDNG